MAECGSKLCATLLLHSKVRKHINVPTAIKPWREQSPPGKRGVSAFVGEGTPSRGLSVWFLITALEKEKESFYLGGKEKEIDLG